ncbi:facilitated trehalose transporter Tret1-like [Coccinella septempunctata]|uniref:facilitated trehalose transporter Tret1-like n=1 Tax=Coccinella septempunctata TaxID=41139 RepID=UPI001D07E296|nr:facilitated trehalose transporter Tret1-like [Coccinella septempunctata]
MENINFRLIASACTVNLMAFANGNAYAWSSTVLIALKSNDTMRNPIGRPITTSEESLITSLVHLGAVCGPILAGILSEKIGRKRALLMFAMPMFLAHVILAFAARPYEFYIARFMLGVGAGSVFTMVPMYVGEIAETRIRGFLGCLLGVFIAFGLLFVYSIGPYVNLKTLSFILLSPLGLFLFLFGFFVPESPYYYLTKGFDRGAEISLNKLRKNDPCANLKELALMKETVQEFSEIGSSVCEQFKNRSFRKGLTITATLMVLQQSVGVTVVFSYMENIFIASGSTFSSSHSTIIVGGIQTAVVLFSSLLADRWGRRLLLEISCGGCSLSLFILGTYFYMKKKGMDMSTLSLIPMSCLIVYTVSFKFGLGAIPWTLVGELFSSKTKSLASTITTTLCVCTAFTTSFIFPTMKDLIGFHWSFWFFSGNGFIALLFCLYYIPETKGKTFQEILKMLDR